MKQLFILFFILPYISYAQDQQTISHAIINSTITITAPEDDDASDIATQGDGSTRFSMRNFGDGETKITSYIKDSLSKTVVKNDMSRSTIIRNNNSHTTTTLIEVMGNKMGFVMTDEDQEQMKKQMDSMMKSRAGEDSTLSSQLNGEKQPAEIVITNDTKKIAGILCKKALVINTRLLGIKDTVPVWFAPDLKFDHSVTGASLPNSGFRGMLSSFTLNGLNQLPGLPMQYEMKMRRGRTLQMEVNKVDLKKEIKDKEFDVPKDFDVKPYSEFSKMFRGMPGGGMQMRMRTQ